MNIRLEKEEMIDFFLLYIRDNMDGLDEKKESYKILERSSIKSRLNILETKVNSNTVLKYNQFKSYLTNYIRILS